MHDWLNSIATQLFGPSKHQDIWASKASRNLGQSETLYLPMYSSKRRPIQLHSFSEHPNAALCPLQLNQLYNAPQLGSSAFNPTPILQFSYAIWYMCFRRLRKLGFQFVCYLIFWSISCNCAAEKEKRILTIEHGRRWTCTRRWGPRRLQGQGVEHEWGSVL